MTTLRRVMAACALGALALLASAPANDARAEYGDVVMNNYSDASGVRPVVFPHWFHRLRYSCKVCHADLGFKFKAGGNEINMLKIIDGQYCGACHNGEHAWSIENCNLCHSAKSRTATQVHESTTHSLVGSAAVAAPRPPPAKALQPAPAKAPQPAPAKAPQPAPAKAPQPGKGTP